MALQEVKKRDGHRVKFNKLNVRKSILNANDSVSPVEQATDDEIESIINKIANIKKECVHIEVIQDIIQKSLMKYGHYDLAERYITYRYIHGVKRQLTKAESSILNLIRGENVDVIQENSNKNAFVNSTQRDLMAGEVSKEISHKFLLPEDIDKANTDCIIHWHDLDYTVQPMINCCLIDIEDIFKNGTVMNNYLIESPKSLRVACTVMTQVIAAVASNQYGGQSVDLRHLGKYVAVSREKIECKLVDNFKKVGIEYTDEQLKNIVDNYLQQEITDGVQTIQYQLNTLYTSNGQSPFVTLFLYIEEGHEYEDEIAMIVREVIRQRYEGIKGKDGRYMTPSFPKLIYVLDENNYKKGTKYWDITQECAKCSIKRSYPDYISAKKMRENYEGNVFSPMGCRSFLAPWKKTAEYVKFTGEPESEIGKYKFEGRFNQGVVSINLPQIAIEANHDIDRFWELFNQRMSLCYKALLLRHRLLEGVLSDVSPIHWQFGVISRMKQGEKIDFLLHGGYSTLSLGYIGFYEMTQALLGKSNTTKEGKDFAMKVMKAMRSQVATWKEMTGLGFALYGTPAESLCYTFARHDLDKYGSIPNVTDHGYYTNSYHIDVREHVNAFEKFKFESEFQHLSTGGSISYVEIPNLDKNKLAVEKLITYIYDTIQYAEFNSKSDLCYECGYEGEISLNSDNQWECPQCHNRNMKQMMIVRRTCGYLGLNDWNEGKRKEIGQRVLHL